jgi:hypothetical protein
MSHATANSEQAQTEEKGEDLPDKYAGLLSGLEQQKLRHSSAVCLEASPTGNGRVAHAFGSFALNPARPTTSP